MADQNQRQLRPGQQIPFNSIRILPIQRAGPLVYQKDGAAVEQGPGNGHTLPLAPGEVPAVFPRDRIQATGH